MKKFHRIKIGAVVAGLVFWLVPNAQAQQVINLTVTQGITRLYRANAVAGFTTFNLSMPANSQSVGFEFEAPAPSTGVTLSATPSAVSNDLTSVSAQTTCTVGPGTGLQATTATISAGLGTGASIYANCPIPPSGKMQLVVTVSAGGGQLFSITAFASSAPPVVPGNLVSAASLTQATNANATISEKGPRWSQVSAPAISTQASAVRAATTGVRHVADCVSYSAGAIAAPAATQLTINLRDGASGAGTVIWSKTVTIPATAAPHYDGNFCGLNLIGSVTTAMTLEFSALLTSEFESVTLTGYDVQ